MQSAEPIEAAVCHGLSLAAFIGAGRWLHVSCGQLLSEVCCRLIVCSTDMGQPCMQAVHLSPMLCACTRQNLVQQRP